MTILHTTRLCIRPIQHSDVSSIVAYRNNPKVYAYQAWDLPATQDSVISLVSDKELGADGWVQRAICLNNQVIGDLGLDTDNTTAEVGITLAEQFWGKGYAQEALQAVIKYSFETLSLKNIYTSIDPRNTSVEKLITRLGFVHQITYIGGFFHRGEWADDAHYNLSKKDWRKND